VVRLLLEKGADSQAKAVVSAVRAVHVVYVAFLPTNLLYPCLLLQDGQTPLDVAKDDATREVFRQQQADAQVHTPLTSICPVTHLPSSDVPVSVPPRPLTLHSPPLAPLFPR
jgi:hypothetical protein